MSTELKAKPKTQKPKLYAVVFVNDDFTPMDFVMQILIQIFNKTVDEAEALMWEIHKNGKGVAGIYTHEVAETKATIVEMNARENEFPLKASVENA